MTEQKQSELEMFHQQWSKDPVTRQLVTVLDKHIDNLIDTLANKSMDTVNVTDQEIRLLAVQLKTNKTIKKLINDTSIFVKNV